jgi:YD repeat-containing protein
MSAKQKSSGVLFIVLMGVILLSTAFLFRDGPCGADVSQGAEDQGSTSVPQLPSTSAQTRTITYTYDNAGRLVGADYGEGQGITYTYDAAGNLLQREVYGVATTTPTPTSTPTPTTTPTSTPTWTPTHTPTVTPTTTPTPTLTPTPTATATPTPSPTPTETAMPKVYLPLVLRGR